MDNIKLYEIDPAYVSYLLSFTPHLFQNKKPGQQNERKYIGVVLRVNGMDYFAPLSSFKPKHEKMKVTFIHISSDTATEHLWPEDAMIFLHWKRLAGSIHKRFAVAPRRELRYTVLINTHFPERMEFHAGFFPC